MSDAIDRALCCGPTCKRGTDATGPCVAATYGAGIRQRAEAAGYVVVPQEPTDAMCLAATLREDFGDRDKDRYGLYRTIYRAMVTAPPEAPDA